MPQRRKALDARKDDKRDGRALRRHATTPDPRLLFRRGENGVAAVAGMAVKCPRCESVLRGNGWDLRIAKSASLLAEPDPGQGSGVFFVPEAYSAIRFG